MAQLAQTKSMVAYVYPKKECNGPSPRTSARWAASFDHVHYQVLLNVCPLRARQDVPNPAACHAEFQSAARVNRPDNE